MYHLLVSAAVVSFALATTGCSSNDPTTTSSTSAPAASVAPSQAATTEPPLAVVPTGSSPAGGLGGPATLVGGATPSCLTDLTTATNLYSWYSYEVQAPPDSNLTADIVCEDAVYTCASLQTGLATIPIMLQKLVTEKGFHQIGAQALIKAAVTIACPNSSAAGYKTAFDRTADEFQAKVERVVHFSGAPIGTTDYGVFMKVVCDRMTPPYAPLQLQSYLQPPGAGSNMVLSRVGAASPPAVLRIFVQQAVLSNCVGRYTQLAGYWMSA